MNKVIILVQLNNNKKKVKKLKNQEFKRVKNKTKEQKYSDSGNFT